MDFSDTATGAVVGLSALALTLVAPIWGNLCEKWGRRRVILIGIVATTAFNVASATLIQLRLELLLGTQLAFVLLLSTRLLNSLFTGGLKPAGQAFIADVTSADSRAKGMGLMGAAFGVGSILGGFSASLSGSQHLLAGYVAISILLLASCFVTAVYLPEPRKQPDDSAAITHAPLPYKRISGFLLITFLGLMLFSLLQHVIPLTLEDRFLLSNDMAIRRSGMTMMLTMIVMILTQSLLVGRLPLVPRNLIVVGSVVCGCAMIAATFSHTPATLMLSMCVFGFGLGLLFPGNLASLSLSVDNDSQGRVAGVNGIGQGLGLASGPIAGSFLHNYTYHAPYIVCVIIMVSIFMMAFVLRRKA